MAAQSLDRWPHQSGEMAAQLREFNWTSTSLGSTEGWPDRLKVMVEQVLVSPLVSSLVCGPDYLLIYNDVAAMLYGNRHPGAFGQPLPKAFPAGWRTVAPLYERAFAGESVQVAGQPLDTRGEGVETDVFDVLLTPVRNADGSVAYVHMTGFEVGDRVRAQEALRDSEARHRLLIESWAQAEWETDADGVVVVDSPSWRAYTGQALPELLGYGWLDAIHHEDRAYAERQWRDAMAAHTPLNAEFRLCTPEGEWRWTNVLAAPVLEASGSIKKWAGINININIDARKRAEAALRESKELRQIAITGGRMGTWRWHLRDNLIWGDAAFLDLWGFPPSDEPRSLGDFTDRMSPQGQAEMGEMVTRAIAAGDAFDGQLAIVGGPTSGCWVRWRGQADAERPYIVNGVSFDVTDQRLAEERLRQSERTLAADLADAERLRDLSERLVPEESFQAIYDEVLSATVAITRADAGTIQTYNPVTKDLELIASLNFSRTITVYFHRVGAGSRTACGIALKTGERAFVDFPDEAGDLGCELLTGEGIQSALAFPLMSRTGTPLGMPNAHWRRARHRPTDRELRFLDLLARQAADLIERRQGEYALRESEEQFQQFSEASPDVLWGRNAETLQWDYLSPAFEEIYGLSREEALEGNDLRRWLELIVPDDRHEAMTSMRRVREGARVTFEFRIRRPVDGRIRWLRNTDFPIRDQSGRLHRIGGISHDITDLKATEAALTHSERRLRTLVEGVPQLVWRAIDHGDWTWASPQWVAFTGQAEPDSHRLGWLEPIHPDDRETARSTWMHAVETGGFKVEYRIRNVAQDAYRWFQTRATPVRDAEGEIIEWLGTSTDIHDLRALQERQEVLVAELQHRTRNLMGVVRATAETTLRSSTDLTDFSLRYRDRLGALARVQGLLSRLEGVERITFDELIRNELTAIGAIDGTMGKVTLMGPDGVALRSSTVQTFALALHELATNAVKYGALTAPSGHLAVTWRLEREEPESTLWLHVDWHESGVTMPPPDVPPRGTGQGRQLIERALPYQLGARTTYVMGNDGVRCSIALPVSSGQQSRIGDGHQPAL